MNYNLEVVPGCMYIMLKAQIILVSHKALSLGQSFFYFT